MKDKNKLYIAKLKAIKPYIVKEFPKNKKIFSTGEKSYISKYYRLLYGQKGEGGVFSRKNIRYSPKSKKQERLVKEYAQIPSGYRLKKYLLPVDDEKARVRFNKKGLRITGKYTKRTFYYFDNQKLARSNNEVKKAVKYLKADRYKIGVGFYETVGNGYNNEKQLIEAVQYIKNNYTTKEHNWRDFLMGIVGYEFDNQAGYAEYREYKKKSGKKKKKKSKYQKLRNR
jgi:hypothetical protein